VVVPFDAIPKGATESLHMILGVGKDVQIFVSLFLADRDLERLWVDRHPVVERLATLRPSAVIAPSYSVWARDPWTEQRYAIKRSLEFYRILQDRGLIAIPHVAWGRRIDAAAVVEWLNQNHPAVVAVDAQCLGPLLEQWARQLAWLREGLVDVPTLLVGGLRPGRRLNRVVAAWKESSYIFNGLRMSASHRELRLAADGRSLQVRHVPHKADQETLLSGLLNNDKEPSLLYERSLRAFEQSVTDGRRLAGSVARSDTVTRVGSGQRLPSKAVRPLTEAALLLQSG
jgi:hypothetical protein